jgi:hypothetical protein
MGRPREAIAIPAEPSGPDAPSAGAAALLADLVEPAKTIALDKLGEVERAAWIVMALLQTSPTPPDPKRTRIRRLDPHHDERIVHHFRAQPMSADRG